MSKPKILAVFEIIRENIIKYNNPLGLKTNEISIWVKDLDLPTKGDILFYTGGEYQLLPYIDSLVKTMAYVDTSSTLFSTLMKARKMINKIGINSEKIYTSLLAKDKERYFSINYKAAYILKKLGYNIFYNKDADLYSGALLYELGFWKELKEYAVKVVDGIKETGAKTIVCLSPHASEMFKIIYPKITDFPDIEVKTFIELVWEKRHLLPPIKYEYPVVIHDSCRMARELGIAEEYRDILDTIGVNYIEAYRNKKWTTCCGGPNKMLFGEISK
ncbi:MAG: (Fe-S)-binding protein, partial [Peptococcaceae bacterium]|nr:(Fe-S)-binding protein [Peptococcaceae bacterium]